jgi:short-subunit dehydrogenase
MRLEGASALVTGASGGIGKAIARALAKRGVSLKLSARRIDVLDGLRGELAGETETLPADLADRASVEELIAAAGAVDVLVANAALPAAGRIESFSAEEIDRALDVNLRAPIQMARALVPGMVERGRGHVVFISSLNGKVASPGSGLYSATKFGLRGFASGMRQDLHGTGVGVTTVFPGFVREAGMFADSGVKPPPGVGTRSPEQVARAVLRGIERDRPEIDVAPLSMRLGVLVAMFAPRLSAAFQRRAGGEKVSDELARAHAELGKR